MKPFQGKKLLILAGAAVHCKVVEAARTMGVHTIVTDYLEGSPAKLMADEQWGLNIFDVDAIVDRCKREKIDGVLNFCIDPAQRPYREICERLSLPCYGNAEQFHIMTDKPAFKAFCEQNGVDVIPAYTEADIEQGRCDYPIFVKPTDSRGSRGQAVCYTKEQAQDAIKEAMRESSDGGVVIEKFMQGKQDFSMTYFVCGGVPYLIRTCDRYLGRLEDKLNKQCVGCVAPSRYSDLYLEKVHGRAVGFIRALGIENGPLFMQGFVDGDTVRFYDPGLRFPGGEYERLLKDATGVDLMSALVEFALTGGITPPKGLANDLYKLNGHHTIQLPITARAGTITVLDGMDEIRQNPKVTSAFNRYEVGETVRETGDVRQRICEVALVLDAGDSVRDLVAWVQSKLTVLDENGKSMLVSLVDPTKLDY
jgi:biotin carboxylase